MSECPSCGGALAPDDKFCASCGAPAPEPEPAAAPEPPQTRTCAACGGEIAADARFCGHCGAAVAGEDEPSAADQPTVVAEEPTLVAEEPTVVDESTLVHEEPTLVAEAPTEVLTPAAAGDRSSRNKKIAIIVGAVAITAAIAGVVLWRGGDDPPPPAAASDTAAPAYTYDETTPATGYDDSSSSPAGVPDMEADALTEEALYGFWSGSLYVRREMAFGDRWRQSDLEYQTAYISISPFENGTYGEFTVEPTSGDSFTGNVTDITIANDVATIRIDYADLGAGATLRVSLQDGYDLVGFYEDDPPPDANWVSWKGDIELPRVMGE